MDSEFLARLIASIEADTQFHMGSGRHDIAGHVVKLAGYERGAYVHDHQCRIDQFHDWEFTSKAARKLLGPKLFDAVYRVQDWPKDLRERHKDADENDDVRALAVEAIRRAILADKDLCRKLGIEG